MKRALPVVIKNYTKRYGSFRGVDDISLEINHGEVFGFLGPNGAGKSTTIRTMLNFISPSDGSIKIYGLDSVKDYKEVKKHVGYLAGDIALYDSMTGRKLLMHLSALGKQTDWKYVDKLADNLKADLDRPIKSLSKGNKQKIGLIQAFMHKPDLLILDEPTSGLDPLMKQVFYDMVLEMKQAGKTVFVSSHDLTEVQKICDRAAFIRDGKLIGVENIVAADSMNVRRYAVTLERPVRAGAFKKIKNVTDVKLEGKKMIVTISGSVGPFIRELATVSPVDLDEQETTLEDLFMHYYKNQETK